MKKALRIAKLELNTLFYSPIAWLLLIVLLFQVSMAYTATLGYLEEARQLRGPSNQFSFLTYSIFSTGNGGLLPGILDKLYLYVPLITMGLMSREVSSGTIKLLYSSPIKVREIVFGKFLAMMAYCLLLVGVFVLFIISGIIIIPHFDVPLLLAGLLGIYLLLCTYSAIGLFMSSLTSYQVVAAISTFVIFAFLAYVGTIWQGVDFVRDLTHSFSMTGRVGTMIDGLLTTKDIFYFGAIIFLFLGLSIIKLQSTRESKPFFVPMARYAGIVVAALAVGYLTSRPGFIGYYDASATKANTISENMQGILRETGDAPIEVTEYINFLDNRTFFRASPEERNDDVDRWAPYVRFKSNIHFHYVYYYDSVPDPSFYRGMRGITSLRALAEKRAKALKLNLSDFKTPEEIHRLIDLKPESNRLVMQLKYKDKTTFLRVFDDMQFWPSETEIAATLKRMMAPLPRIDFLVGGYERSIDKIGDRDYQTLTSRKTFRYALVNQGFDVDTISAESRDIPTDIAALAIADPKTDFSSVALARIQKFIGAGGNLLIGGEPGKQSVLNPLLHTLGVQMKEGTIVQATDDYSPDLVMAHLTPADSSLTRALKNDYLDSLSVSMPGAVALSYDSTGPYTALPLLVTDRKTSWNKMGPIVTDSAELRYAPENGDERGPFPTAVSLTRMMNGRQQRIVVTGDADLMSNSELNRRNARTANFVFNTALFGSFTYGRFPIETTRPRSKDNHLVLSEGGLTAIKVIFWGVVPGLLLVMGIVLLIRRRRK
jgi:ABC-2 type transport system permease protein